MKTVVNIAILILATVGICCAVLFVSEQEAWQAVGATSCLLACYVLADESIWN